MARWRWLWLWTLVGLGFGTHGSTRPPNVLLLYADDLGWGDLGCYGATRLATPHLDRLARAGLRFTDAHSSAATCTPSRYSLLTGEYAWRMKGTGVLPGDASLVIEPGRTTLPALFQRAGYVTGVVGKWHLGLGTNTVDWNGEISPGPLDIGFSEAFIMAATGDRVPCVYVENRRVWNLDPADPLRVSYQTPFAGEPTGRTRPDLLQLHPSHGHDQAIVHGISRIGYLTGGRAAWWRDETMADEFVGRARAFLDAHRTKPFFLYLAFHDPHVPRVPHPRFAGKSGLGPRGDVILQLDANVGEVLAELDRLQLAEQTLVIFTSDNGAVVDDGYRDDAIARLGDHRPNGPWRGGKYSKYEGGTRVPFLVRWPGHIAPGVSSALFSQVDLLATLAALIGQSPDARQSPDSENHLATLLGKQTTGRREAVEQGQGLALRQEQWKFITPSDGAPIAWETGLETGNQPQPQLYDLSADPGETNNLALQAPDRVRQMQQRLGELRAQPR